MPTNNPFAGLFGGDQEEEEFRKKQETQKQFQESRVDTSNPFTDLFGQREEKKPEPVKIEQPKVEEPKIEEEPQKKGLFAKGADIIKKDLKEKAADLGDVISKGFDPTEEQKEKGWGEYTVPEKIKASFQEAVHGASVPLVGLTKGAVNIMGATGGVVAAADTIIGGYDGNVVADNLMKAAESSYDILNYAPPRSYNEGDNVFDNPKLLFNLEYISRGVSEQVPNLVAALATGGKALYGIEAGSYLYDRYQKNDGTLNGKDVAVGATVGIANGFLDKLGLDVILGKNKTVKRLVLNRMSNRAFKILSSMGISAASEMPTEYMQEVIPVIATKVVFDEGGTIEEVLSQAHQQGKIAASQALVSSGVLGGVSQSIIVRQEDKDKQKELSKLRKEIVNEERATAEEPVIDNERAEVLEEKQERVIQLENDLKETLVSSSKREGGGGLKIEVMPTEDGKFAISYSAETDSVGLDIRFDQEQTFDSKEAAMKSATTEIKAWADQEAKTASGEDLSALMNVIDKIDDVEANSSIFLEEQEAPAVMVGDTFIDEEDYSVLEKFVDAVNVGDKDSAEVTLMKYQAVTLAEGYGIENAAELSTQVLSNRIAKEVLEPSRIGIEEERTAQAQLEKTQGKLEVEARKIANEAPTRKDFFIETKGLDLTEKDKNRIWEEEQKKIDKKIIEEAPALAKIEEKYEHDETVIDDDLTLYHGGTEENVANIEKGEFEAMLDPEKKEAATGGNRMGLSTTTSVEMAQDFAAGVGGRSIATIELKKGSMIFDILDNEIDDISEDETTELAEKYDAIRDKNNLGGENEVRILSEKALTSFDPIYDEVFEDAKDAIEDGEFLEDFADGVITRGEIEDYGKIESIWNKALEAKGEAPAIKKDVKKLLSEEFVQKKIDKILSETNPQIRKAIQFQILAEVMTKSGQEARALLNRSTGLIKVSRTMKASELDATIRHEIRHAALKMLSKKDKQKIRKWYNNLSEEQLRDLFGKDENNRDVYDIYKKHYKGNDLLMAEEAMMWNFDEKAGKVSGVIDKLREFIDEIMTIWSQITGQINDRAIRREAEKVYDFVFNGKEKALPAKTIGFDARRPKRSEVYGNNRLVKPTVLTSLKISNIKKNLSKIPGIKEAIRYNTKEEFISEFATLFHGTASRFDEFKSEFLGDITGAGSAENAFWFTDSEEVAAGYAMNAAENGPVDKAMREAEELERKAKLSNKDSDWDKYYEKVEEYEKLASYEETFERRKNANVKRVFVTGNFSTFNAKGKTPQELSIDDNIDSWLSEKVAEAKSGGFDGLIIKNLDDAAGLYDTPSTHYAVFNPKNIRTEEQLSSIWDKNKEAPAIKKDVREEKIAKEETRIEELKAKDVIRKSPKFAEEMEGQYESFKKLVTPKKLDEIEDATQLREKFPKVNVDDILHDRQKTDDEMFILFKNRRFEDIAEKDVAREERKEVSKRSKNLRKLKRDLRQRMAGLKTGRRLGAIETKKEIKKVQTEIVRMLKNSRLDLKDKGKFISFIKNTQTESQLFKRLDEITERIARLERLSEARRLVSAIKKEVKTTGLAKGKKPKGKFTPETQIVFDKIRDAVKLNRDQAAAKLQENLLSNPSGVLQPAVALENRILRMFSGNDVRSPEELQKILDTIIELKQTGRMINELKKFNMQSELQALKDLTVDRVTGGKGLKKGIQTTGIVKTRRQKIKSSLKTVGRKMVFSWNGLLDILEFGNKAGTEVLKKNLGVITQENKFKKLQKEFLEEFTKVISDSYGIQNKPNRVHKKIIDLQKEVDLGEFKNAESQKVKIVLTKDEIIKRYMEMHDPTLLDSFEKGNLFTPEIMNAITQKMTANDKKFADAQFKLYKRQWELINPVYSKINGVNLPFNEFYSPIVREGFEVDSTKGLGTFMEDAHYRTAVTSKSFNTRVKNTLPIAKQSSLDVLTRHIMETNYYIAWAEKIRELDAVFKDNTVRIAIKQEFTPQLLESISNSINDMTTNGNRNAKNIPVVDFFRKNFTVGALMIKPALAAKQMVSTVAYLEKLNPIDFTIGVADFFRNPVKNLRTLNNESVFIKTRGANMERDINDAMKTDAFKQFSKKQTFMNLAMLNIHLGDKGAIVVGSWAMRRKLLKEGKSLTEAKKIYEEFGSDTQQSADISRLSEVQRGGSLEKLFTMFKSSPRQYLAKEVNAIRSLFQKGGTSPKNITRVAKTMAIYHVLLPVIFQYISNLGGWGEEDKKDYKRAAILGSLNGLFIFGDLIDRVIRASLGLRVWDTGTPLDTITKDVEKAIGKLGFDDIVAEDVFEALKELSSAGNVIGLPVKQAEQLKSGLNDIAEGDVKQGIAQILGWSEYRADARFGERTNAEEVSDLIQQGKGVYEAAEEMMRIKGVGEDSEDYDKEFNKFVREAEKQTVLEGSGKRAEKLSKTRLNSAKVKLLKKWQKEMSKAEFETFIFTMLDGHVISENVLDALEF